MYEYWHQNHMRYVQWLLLTLSRRPTIYKSIYILYCKSANDKTINSNLRWIDEDARQEPAVLRIIYDKSLTKTMMSSILIIHRRNYILIVVDLWSRIDNIPYWHGNSWWLHQLKSYRYVSSGFKNTETK